MTTTPNYAKDLDEIAESVIAGKCILFLGAAVHSPPPSNNEAGYSYTDDERPPIGSALSKTLAAKSDFAVAVPGEDERNLQRVSLHYELTKGRRALINELIAAVATGKRPSPVVRALAALNFQYIVTTNYDRLFESALGAINKRPYISVYRKNEEIDLPTADFPANEDVTRDRPFVIKMHGDIEDSSSIVITDEDYVHFILRMTETGRYDPIPKSFQEKFRRWPTLFIGYSLKDYNLRVLFRTMRWKIDRASYPKTYSIDLYPDPLIKTVWGDRGQYVSFLAQDVWTFVPALYQKITGEGMPG